MPSSVDAPATQTDLARVLGRSQPWISRAQHLAVDPLPATWSAALEWARRHGFEMRWTAAVKLQGGRAVCINRAIAPAPTAIAEEKTVLADEFSI